MPAADPDCLEGGRGEIFSGPTTLCPRIIREPTQIFLPISPCEFLDQKPHRRKVLLSSFYLNGHTLGFHPQTQKLEPPCTA